MRLTRLAKIFKLLKKNRSFLYNLTEKLRINNGLERLIMFSFFFAIYIHVSACMYILLAQMESDDLVTWIQAQNNLEGIDLYILSCYFTITTVSTVGYGDVSPCSIYERLFCILLMIVGACAFTFVSGALSSIISNYD